MLLLLLVSGGLYVIHTTYYVVPVHVTSSSVKHRQEFRYSSIKYRLKHSLEKWNCHNG